MGVSLDKYEKKLSILMGIKCLVTRDEVNMQVCTIVHKCAKNKRNFKKKGFDCERFWRQFQKMTCNLCKGIVWRWGWGVPLNKRQLNISLKKP
jgi:hypothetical protein